MLTIGDLVDYMAECLADQDDEAYENRYMKRQLLERYGEDIVIAARDGTPDVVTLKQTASKIIRNFYKTDRDQNSEIEKHRMIQTTSELIRSDIQNTVPGPSNVTYPSALDIASVDKNIRFLPDSLRELLVAICPNADGVKIAAIGQAIIQNSKPRSVIAPLQLGLGVEMHRQYSSRFLIDTLYKLGFSSSYAEIQRYEANSAVTATPTATHSTEHFIQFVADNVDHNVQTVDGSGSIHAMGMISVTTPAVDTHTVIPRGRPTPSQICESGKVQIHPFTKALSAGELTYKANVQSDLRLLDNTDDLDFLWILCKPYIEDVPSYSAFMQSAIHGEHSGASSVNFLPMIDMNPNDPSCIYSTLLHVLREAEKAKSIPILTYDQPLFWKALLIVQSLPSTSPLKMIILRLGAFHSIMSFQACIGHIMTGTGLQEALETIYAPNSVIHIMSGKAVSRASRAHSLAQVAVFAVLIQHMKENSTELCQEHLTEATSLLQDINDGNISIDDAQDKPVLKQIRDIVMQETKNMDGMKTSKLWLQYIEMVDLVKKLTKAERTGNFKLHLACLRRMLPYLVASGHNNYTKSILMYVQAMDQLEIDDQATFNALSSNHSARLSDRFYGGLSLDLIIEMVLMRNIKSSGGLTHGKGFSEVQRTIWFQAMPHLANIHRAMQQVTDTSCTSSEQHKEAGFSRKNRDNKDLSTLISFFEDRSPFVDSAPLRQIVTGEIADETVNVEQARAVGESILTEMEGQAVEAWKFKKSLTVKMFSSSRHVETISDSANIDQQLLFQRLMLARDREGLDDEEVFSHELCAFPPSMFESSGLPLNPKKSTIADYLWTEFKQTSAEMPLIADYVLDGGDLIHKIPWVRNMSAKSIVDKYIDFVTKAYGRSTTIVFDGYTSGPQTKDIAQMRRKGGVSSNEVLFDENTPIRAKKEVLLSNNKNKQRFVDLLGARLTAAGHNVVYAPGDADVLIVHTTLQTALLGPTVLIGEDTDLLVLLISKIEEQHQDIYFAPKKKTAHMTRRIWNIHALSRSMGNALCRSILFLHAIGGCDTTSRLFGVGKGTIVKKYIDTTGFREYVDMFLQSSIADDIIRYGERALIHIYGGSSSTKSLTELRCTRFQQKTATRTSYVQCKSLPPTSSSAKFHCLRVHHQLKEWSGTQLDPYIWGWLLHNGRLHPVYMDKEPAPSVLLKVVHCSCTTDCSKSTRCSCKKSGLFCTAACKNCCDSTCGHMKITHFDSQDEDAYDDMAFEADVPSTSAERQ